MHGDVVDQSLEIVGASHEIGFAVDFDHSANPITVHISVYQTLQRFALAALFGFGKAFFAHRLKSLVKITLGFDQCRLGVSQTHASQVF